MAPFSPLSQLNFVPVQPGDSGTLSQKGGLPTGHKLRTYSMSFPIPKHGSVFSPFFLSFTGLLCRLGGFDTGFRCLHVCMIHHVWLAGGVGKRRVSKDRLTRRAVAPVSLRFLPEC